MAHLRSGVCLALNEPGPVSLTDLSVSLNVVLIGSYSNIRILGDFIGI